MEIEMTDELLKAVQEIQISQRFMLKKLNEISHTSDGQCTCARTQEQHRREIDELKSKVNELESVRDEKETLQKKEEKEYQEIKERVQMLETFVLTLSTNDPKKHSETLKHEWSDIQNGCAVTEIHYKTANIHDANEARSSKKGSQVDCAHNIECSKTSADRSTPYNLLSKKTTLQDKQSSLPAKSKENTVAQASVVKEDNFVADNLKKQTAQSKGASCISETPIKGGEGATKDNASSKKSCFKMVEQTERKTYYDEHYWRYLARNEIEDGRKTLKDVQGVHTVIIIDISESMAEENAWTHALRFVRDYLNGLEEISTRYGLSNEHVALVTFGHDTRVQQRLTNNYKLIRQLVENQRLGGPSPLYGGLALALAAAGSSKHRIEKVNQVAVFHKVIIVTDGHLTEVGQYEGPDKAVGDLSETQAKIIQIMEELKSSHLDMFYVQAGKESEETRQFSELMMTIVDGKKLDYKSGRQFSRRTYLTSKIPDPFRPVPLSLFGDLSKDDKVMIEEIISDVQKSPFIRMHTDQSRNRYRVISDSNLQPVGIHVQREPDWQSNMKDSNDGDDNGEHEWDKWSEGGQFNVYEYRAPGHVVIVEEPRIYKFGQEIEVGRVVRPGKDWTQSARNEKYWQRGVVIKVAGPKATVRWDDGEIGDYTYSGTGKCEIEVEDYVQFGAFGSEVGHKSDFKDPQPHKGKRNKNKNVE